MFDIITFGSATRDTFLILRKRDYRVITESDRNNEKFLCLPFGSKIFIDNVKVFSGGGGTNTSCTFANQGFKTAYIGKVGNDKRGEAVIDDLKKFKIETSFIKKDETYSTAYSVILSFPQGDRTILIYRGACHFITENDVSWEKLKQTKWFYISPLSEKSVDLFNPLVKFAGENNIKIAANLGDTQLNLPKQVLIPILKKIDILILNKEEASLLAGISIENEKGIIKKLISFVGAAEISKKQKKLVVITKGKKGSLVSDGEYLFEAPTPSVLPFEKTGAGDAFASGFLSGFLQKNSIEYAMQLGTANATSCIQEIGAKNGLLKKSEWGKWPKVKVVKSRL